MNSARILKLDRPVSKVIVGNSEVADATVADAKTIVLTGAPMAPRISFCSMQMKCDRRRARTCLDR